MDTRANPFLEKIIDANLSNVIMVCRNHKTGLINYIDDDRHCRKTIFGDYKPKYNCGNKDNTHSCETVQQFIQSFPVFDTTFVKQ